MARSNRFAAGYFFMGITVGASLAIQELAARRPNGGDIRSRTTGGPQTRRQGPAAAGPPTRHGPDKFRTVDRYSSEHTIRVHNRPTRPPSKSVVAHGPKKFAMAAPQEIIWGPEVTE